MLSRKVLTLRPYQEDIVNKVRSCYASGSKRVLAVSPTGSGKTVVFSHIARTAASDGRRVMILAHRIELLEQCGDKLYSNYVDYGYLNPKYTPNMNAKVQVGSMQTVAKRMKHLNFRPDLIIIDECHRVMGPTYTNIVNYFAGSYVLGVTATPVRLDGKPLGDMFEQMVLGPTMKELINMGNLVRPVTYQPPHILDLSRVGSVHGDYSKAQAAAIMKEARLHGDPVEHYREKADGWPAIAYCIDVEDAYRTAEEFRNGGYNFVPIDGKMSVYERKRILRDLADRKIHGVTSVDLLTEGVDIPIVACGILLRPTKSLSLYLQMGGRTLRPAPGKDRAIILDHSGCSLPEELGGHGLLQQDRQWSLVVPEKKKRSRSVSGLPQKRMRQCPSCNGTFETFQVCPNCDTPYYSGPADVNRDGKLIEVTEEDMIAFKRKLAAEISAANTLGELEAIESQRGFMPGWAKAKYAEKNRRLGIA